MFTELKVEVVRFVLTRYPILLVVIVSPRFRIVASVLIHVKNYLLLYRFTNFLRFHSWSADGL